MRPKCYQEDARLIPVPPETDRELARLQHRDIDQMTRDERWAEALVLTQALAWRLRHRHADRLIVLSSGDVVTESWWIRQRLACLDDPRRRAQ
jgi:hypothetical protein